MVLEKEGYFVRFVVEVFWKILILKLSRRRLYSSSNLLFTIIFLLKWVEKMERISRVTITLLVDRGLLKKRVTIEKGNRIAGFIKPVKNF